MSEKLIVQYLSPYKTAEKQKNKGTSMAEKTARKD